MTLDGEARLVVGAALTHAALEIGEGPRGRDPVLLLRGRARGAVRMLNRDEIPTHRAELAERDIPGAFRPGLAVARVGGRKRIGRGALVTHVDDGQVVIPLVLVFPAAVHEELAELPA